MKFMAAIAILAIIPLSGCHKVLKPLLGSGHTENSTPPTATPTETTILICAGQSNMEGQGQRTDYPQHPWVTVRGNLSTWRRGPCYAAAVAIAESVPTKKVIAIQCAKGATSISQWQPGQTLYSTCLDYIAQSRQNIPIYGFIFWQGEYEARQPPPYQTWPQEFLTMTSTLKSDLDQPNLPIVFAQLGLWCDQGRLGCDQTLWSSFKSLQLNAISRNIDMIKTDDQPTIDNIHHDAATFQIIGTRFAQALKRLQPITPTNDNDY